LAIPTVQHLKEGEGLSEQLNRECFCVGLDEAALRSAIAEELAAPGLFELVRERCPYVFAAQPVFVSSSSLAAMRQAVLAVNQIARLPAYQDRALARAPAIARFEPANPGVFYGYDFHVEGGRIGLIEINTNAGGAMLNLVLARAHRACCAEVAYLLPGPQLAESFSASLAAMFAREWQCAGSPQGLRRVALVDHDPLAQFLYPEFLLFRHWFERQGIETVIGDVAELNWTGRELLCAGQAVDLVYNRSTDFYFSQPESAALAQAYLSGRVIVTPHPRGHALFADKRNLGLLGNERLLQEWGVPPDQLQALTRAIPETQEVTPERAEFFWENRKNYFFKPHAGYGSRAAYRGDKLTTRVFGEIAAGGYVAQALVVPGTRRINPSQDLKYDLRHFAYCGESQWVAARLYMGQTTNLRTPGGGFAPVYPIPEPSGSSAEPASAG
jgi:hypothetical protein